MTPSFPTRRSSDLVTDRLVAFLRAVGVERLQPLAEVIHEPQLGAAVARPIDDLVVPLHQPMGIGEGALLFAGKLRRHEEDLRLDLLRPQLAVANRMALRPEIGRSEGRRVGKEWVRTGRTRGSPLP